MANNMYLTETFFLHSDFSIWSTSIILCQQDKLHKKSMHKKKEMQIKSNFTDDIS